MGEIRTDPELLQRVASTLRNARTDLDGSAVEPPQPQAGVVTEMLSASLSLLCEGIGNVSASVGGVGDAVAEGHDTYVDTDQDQAIRLQRQDIQAEQPR